MKDRKQETTEEVPELTQENIDSLKQRFEGFTERKHAFRAAVERTLRFDPEVLEKEFTV